MHRGEIDIIARQGPTIVFVEVRARASTKFGLPLESVKGPKQIQVRKVAQAYLQKHRLPEDRTACRFDVLSVVWSEGRVPALTHIQNAF
jgi:putative endonuclease